MTNPARRDILKAGVALAVASVFPVAVEAAVPEPSPIVDLAWSAAQQAAQAMDRRSLSWWSFQADRGNIIDRWAMNIRERSRPGESLYFAIAAVWDRNTFGSLGPTHYGTVEFRRFEREEWASANICVALNDGLKTVESFRVVEADHLVTWKAIYAAEGSPR